MGDRDSADYTTMRRTIAIVVFFIFFNASAILIEVSGTAAAMGVEAPVGITTGLDEATGAVNGLAASNGVGDTLFGSFTAAARTIEVMAKGVFAGPIMLTSAGIPTPIVTFLFAPAGIIVAMDLLHATTGRGFGQ